jgi:hypothetical protein
MEKLVKRRISRNSILLYCTKIHLFYIAAHCFGFYFPSRVQQSELCRSMLTKMPIFFAFIFCSVTYFVSYFVLTHKLSIVFLFWHKKAKYFQFTALSKGLFCFNALVVKLYFIVSHHTICRGLRTTGV